MPGKRRIHFLARPAIWLVLATLLAACGLPAPVRPPAPTSVMTAEPETSPSATPLAQPDLELLRLASAFRFELTLRPAGAPDEPATVVSGSYRDGAWSQITRQGQDPAEELVVAQDRASGALHSYTRAEGGTWTRWPGLGFDAGYGLASPFAVLRLYPLADTTAPADSAAPTPVPGAAAKLQATFRPTTIERLLKAGAAAVSATVEEQAALEEQLRALFVTQTVTYWISSAGHVLQAAATLLLAGDDGEPVPWLEAIWEFSDYDDPSIAITAPANYSDVSELAGTAGPEAAGGGNRSGEVEPAIDPAATLRIRAFANQGVPAGTVTVTVYPAGKKQAVDERAVADAQFALAAGKYDVLVRASGAERWIEDVVVEAGTVASRDVLFSFGTLALTIRQGAVTPQVDVVVYPAGQRQVWADYRRENPAQIPLPAGLYDIEVALPDLTGTKTVTGIEIKPGETTVQEIELGS